MPEQVVMPRLSDTMTEGTISKWLKHPGDEVTKGEPLVEIETDKANIELEAYASGKLARIVLNEGQSAPVGDLIGEIALAGENVASPAPAGQGQSVAPTPAPDQASKAQAQAAPAAPSVEQPAATSAEAAAQQPTPESPGAAVTQADTRRPESGQTEAAAPAVQPAGQQAPSDGQQRAPAVAQAPAAEQGQLRASPMARRLARELAVDLAQVRGSGPLGRIQKEDVEAAAKSGPAASAQPSGPLVAALAAADAEIVEMTQMQRTIARRMADAKSTVPHFYVSMEADMQRAVDNLADLNEGLPKDEQPTINDLVVRACALTLADYPDVNSFYQDGKLIRNHRVNIGLAVAVPNGLIVPVVKDAGQKSLRQLAADAKALVHKMREGKAQPQDYEGGTFSVSNLGMYGVEEFAAIINPPQSAILAVGAVRDKPVVVGGQLAISKRCMLTLSADHRVFYGATAAEFLRAVKRRLEKPLPLFL